MNYQDQLRQSFYANRQTQEQEQQPETEAETHKVESVEQEQQPETEKVETPVTTQEPAPETEKVETTQEAATEGVNENPENTETSGDFSLSDFIQQADEEEGKGSETAVQAAIDFGQFKDVGIEVSSMSGLMDKIKSMSEKAKLLDRLPWIDNTIVDALEEGLISPEDLMTGKVRVGSYGEGYSDDDILMASMKELGMPEDEMEETLNAMNQFQKKQQVALIKQTKALEQQQLKQKLEESYKGVISQKEQERLAKEEELKNLSKGRETIVSKVKEHMAKTEEIMGYKLTADDKKMIEAIAENPEAMRTALFGKNKDDISRYATAIFALTRLNTLVKKAGEKAASQATGDLIRAASNVDVGAGSGKSISNAGTDGDPNRVAHKNEWANWNKQRAGN